MAFLEHDHESVIYCNILAPDADNTSDHLPIKMGVVLSVATDGHRSLKHAADNMCFPKFSWDNFDMIDNYTTYLQSNLETLSPYDPNQCIDTYIDKLNYLLHDAAMRAAGSGKRLFKPKPYWCPELSRLRDKKRFWWHLWDSNGRPRHGAVYECYKGVKKLFRKVSRGKMQNIIDNGFNSINADFEKRKMSSFWNKIKLRQRRKIKSSLSAQLLADHYANTMARGTAPLDTFQQNVTKEVADYFAQCMRDPQHKQFSVEDIDVAIRKLRKNVSPGIDGIVPEHLIHGNSELLRSHLCSLYNAIFNQTLIPHVLSIGIIVPILKKNTLNPNEANNYRPITLSSTHGKIIELLILPPDGAHENQFGFRTGRGTAMACSFLNDLMQYCRFNGSPMFICSLDAEKCFDTIWHDGLFYKLIDILPQSHWLYLYRLYNRSALFAGKDRTASHSVYLEEQSKVVSFPRLCLTYLLMIFWSNYRPLDAVYA